MHPKPESLINQIFFEKYKVIRKIGQGSFGRIYSCQDITTNELYAMKVEENSFQNNVLETESKYLTYLKGFGIPEIKFFGHSEKYHILIETLLDKSLENLFSESHGNFNLKDISMIGIQVLDRLEYIHNKNIIHRDIKPDNFVIGKNDNKKIIYIIDFGLAKKYRNSQTLEHIPFRMTKRLTGTARYASVNALKGGEQSRKDDLESLAYMILYFLRGSLPWMGVAGITKGDKYKKIYYLKKNIGADKLFEDLPDEFKEFYLYVKKLEFEQDPDYNYCRKLFLNVIEKKFGDVNDNFFTWCKGINEINKDYFSGSNIINNNDETGKSMKSTKILNMCNSNIQLEKINNKKIKKISVTFIDKRNKNKNNIKNSAYNFSVEKKRNKSFVIDDIYDIDNNFEEQMQNSEKKKNKEIIVTNSNKSNNSKEDYSIEGEIDKKKKVIKKKENKNIFNYKNKINILSLTRINKKNDSQFVYINKFNKNLNRTKTNRDLLITKKNFNFLISNQLGNKSSRNRFPKNRSNDSKTKSDIRKKVKNKTSISNFYKEIISNSPGKIKIIRNKITPFYNTHTNIQNKKKTKIKYTTKIQNKSKSKSKSKTISKTISKSKSKSKSNSKSKEKSKSKSRNNAEKSNKKISILLEDFINTKKSTNIIQQIITSRTNNIKNYLKNKQTYKYKNSKISSYPKKSNNKNKDAYNISAMNIRIKRQNNNLSKKQRSTISKNTSKGKNERKKVNSLNKKNSKCHSISNKQLKVKQIFSVNKNKRDIIININKCFQKTKKNNSKQKNNNYLNKIFNKTNNKKHFESRNNTINIESIVFVGDSNNINKQYSQKSINKNSSKSRSKNNSKNKSSPKNGNLRKNNKNEKNNFLKKFKISILCSNKKTKTNNNSKNKSVSKIKKKTTDSKNHIYYNNISLKLGEKKSKINSKRNNNKNIIYNYNSKKFGPLSFNNLITNMRTKKNININHNILFNNSLTEKKFFMQSSFNSSDSNYILNNINNNNIIVNNYSSSNNSNSNISKRMINSFTLNKNIFSDEVNENNSNNNFGGLFNNSNSIFKDFIVRSNKNVNKKVNNSRQNIMKFIKKFNKNNVIKDNIQKTKIKKK